LEENIVVCAGCSGLILDCHLCVNAGRGICKESGVHARCRECRSLDGLKQ
jgi:hypothetical protein